MSHIVLIPQNPLGSRLSFILVDFLCRTFQYDFCPLLFRSLRNREQVNRKEPKPLSRAEGGGEGVDR